MLEFFLLIENRREIKVSHGSVCVYYVFNRTIEHPQKDSNN